MSAGASTALASSSARSLTTSSVNFLFLTFLYGVMRKPYSSISA
jgi:hypothetical protein